MVLKDSGDTAAKAQAMPVIADSKPDYNRFLVRLRSCHLSGQDVFRWYIIICTGRRSWKLLLKRISLALESLFKGTLEFTLEVGLV